MGWHRGLVIKRGGCQLSMPYVLWDTRTWDGSMGLGTAGLENLGQAGTLFDLDVAQLSSGGQVFTYGRQNNGAYTAVPSVDWSDLGGEPCVAPFTFITAVGSLPPDLDVPDPSGYVEADIIFSNQGLYCQSYIFPDFGVVDDKADRSSFTQIYIENSSFLYQYAQWSPPFTEVEGSGDAYIREHLLVVTLTPKDDAGTMYRVPYPSGTPVSVAENTVSGLQEEFEVYTRPGFDCDTAPLPIAGDTHFFYFGEDRRIGTGPVPGEAWNSGIGAALFRGCPNEADLQQWYDYFFGDYVPWNSRIPYDGGWAIWSDGFYVYHEFRSDADLTPIPGRTLPTTIDIFMVGGGGGSSGYVTTTFEGGGGGGGGEIIEATVAAPVTAQAFVRGNGGPSQTDGGNSTFMGYTARGGKGSVGANGGNSGGGSPGGTRIVAPPIKAAGGGASDDLPGGNAVSPTVGKGGQGRSKNWALGGLPIRYGAGGNGGGQTGSVTQTPPEGGGGSNNSPAPIEYRGGGAGGRISSSNSAGYTGASGGLLIRYELP